MVKAIESWSITLNVDEKSISTKFRKNGLDGSFHVLSTLRLKLHDTKSHAQRSHEPDNMT